MPRPKRKIIYKIVWDKRNGVFYGHEVKLNLKSALKYIRKLHFNDIELMRVFCYKTEWISLKNINL